MSAGAEARGLTSTEAAQRARRFGPNALARTEAVGLAREVLRLLGNPLVVVLLVAAGLSAGMGEAANAAIIAIVIGVSVAIDGVQTHRSLRAAEALRRSVAVRATVRRDGEWREIHAEDVVPGDVVRLAAGDLVPGDARLLEAKDLFADQAALTGESYPAEKRAGGAASTDDLAAASGLVFAGTSIVGGIGVAVVLETGPRTAFGRIAVGLAAEPPQTAFERDLAQFGLLILRVVVALVMFAFLALAIARHDPIEAFLFAIALAVGLTPEFLPVLVTITLARGAVEMARDGVIVKQLRAIENLGAIDVLCTDKTGTLTEGTLRLVHAVDGHGEPCDEALFLAVLNGSHESGLRSPLDEAILRAPHPEPVGWEKLDEVPFDFGRRRVSVVLAHEGRRLMITKGAPEAVLAACTALAGADRAGERPLDAEARAAAVATVRRFGDEGLRVLAVARRTVSTGPPFEPADEHELTLVGLLAFADPPRADAAEAVAALARDGIRVVMLTGDHEGVARSVARQVGLPVGRVVTGQGLDAVRPEALPRLVEETDVYARLDPEQKTRVIRALQAGGHAVGYLGDGINDAPALRLADVGLSVESAVDVAREAAPFILTRPGLATIHLGVLAGRRSFANVLKFVMMETSSNFGNVFSMACAAALLPFLPMLPMQILLNNLLYDMAQIAIPGDVVDRAELARPRRWDLGFIQAFMLRMGPVSSLFDVLTFWLLLAVFQASPALFHAGWFVESLLTQTLVIFVIRTRGSPLASRPGAGLVAAVLGVGALAVWLPFSPARHLLGFEPLPPVLLALIVALTAAYLLATEALKRRFYARYGG